MRMTATYSPEDNKLRLYSVTRLDPETYAQVRAAGFIFAPKQDLFVAPAWSPEREDLLIELCGEIDDEDTTLEERAEERAERFEGYSDRRMADAEAAHAAVSAIADNIPLGQPIIVGHHSERHARRDQKRIENGMRKAVANWKTSEYWKDRAEGATSHAKYKERPDVRARRIKGLEADLRKAEKRAKESALFLSYWRNTAAEPDPARQLAKAQKLANVSHVYIMRDGSLAKSSDNDSISIYSALRTDEDQPEPIVSPAKVATVAIELHERSIAANERWLQHYQNRLTYERAMLAADGGLAADRFDFQPGGRVLVSGFGRDEWVTILRVNKKVNILTSLTTNRDYVPIIGPEEVKDYQPPTAADTATVKKATTLSPLVNYPGEGFRHMTAAEYEKRFHFIREANGDGRAYCYVQADPRYAPHRLRCVLKGGPGLDCHNPVAVYLTDKPEKFPPLANITPPTPEIAAPAPDMPSLLARAKRITTTNEPNKFQQIGQVLKSGGVQVVSVPSLYPTPPPLARRMIELADLQPGQTVLEPSAGTGNILAALPKDLNLSVRCVEINAQLCRLLTAQGYNVECADFLEWAPADFVPDVVLMNPPFDHGSDITHVKHALSTLKLGGKLVAIVANGTRQRAQLLPLVDESGGEWIDLPEETFAGTNVRAALITITKGTELG